MTRGSSGRGRYTEIARVVDDVGAPVRGVEVRASGADRSYTVDAEQPLTGRAVAPSGDVPRAERVEDPPGIDHPGRHLVAGERVVVDLELLERGDRALQAVDVVERPDVDREPPLRPQRVLELVERGRQRPRAVGAGNRQERSAGGEQREALRRHEPQWSLEVLREPDLDLAVDHRHVDEPVGGVRREAAQRQQRQITLELALGHFEALGELGDRDARVREHPRHDREHALEPRSDERARAHASARNQATTSSRSSAGPNTSAWSRRSRSQLRNAARFTTGSATSTLPSS